MKRMRMLPALLIMLVGVSLPILPLALAKPPHKNDFTGQGTGPEAPKLVSFPSGDLRSRRKVVGQR